MKEKLHEKTEMETETATETKEQQQTVLEEGGDYKGKGQAGRLNCQVAVVQ